MLLMITGKMCDRISAKVVNREMGCGVGCVEALEVIGSG